MTLFALKESLSALSAELSAVSAWIGENAGNPAISIEDIKAKQTRQEELMARFQAVKAEHDRVEAEDRSRAAAKKSVDDTATDPKTAAVDARGRFYRAALSGGDVRPVVQAAYQHLGAIPTNDADLGYGEHLLPTNMSNEIISMPFDENPMRSIITMSNVTGLVMPKLEYTVDDDFVTDKDVAKELKTTGDEVKFGRFKSKIKAQVSDTVLRGTPTGLASWIDGALRSGLAVKEKKVLFAAAPATDVAHMSLYSTANNIKAITAATIYDAIVGAIGDLHDRFAERATIVMRRVDYLSMIKELANGSVTLWGAKPEDVLGYPVVFCDLATIPVVGDFSQVQLNYDIGATYDTDKDVDKGVYKFVLTAWYDLQIKLKAALRLAKLITP